jgi:hypothetical protein
MKLTKNYSKSPAKAFDAVEDVKSWIGGRWDTVSDLMRQVPEVHIFSIYAEMQGVQGYPVQAWYELYFGQGSWDKAWDKHAAEEIEIAQMKGTRV